MAESGNFIYCHKPGILRDFSENGKLKEFSLNSVQPQGKIVTKYF